MKYPTWKTPSWKRRPAREEHAGCQPLLAALALVAALLAGCGGGGGSPTAVSPSPTAPSGPGYTVSGTMAVTETSAVDSDTNDPNQAGRADNGAFESAQSLPNPVQLIGYLAMPGEGPAGPASEAGDAIDGYRLLLEEGQVVELEFAADPRQFDIDLFVFDGNRVLKGQSIGVNKYECVRITTSGEYVLGVQVFPDTSTGGSIYQLRIGAPGSGTSCANATGAGELLIAREIVAQASPAARKRLTTTRKSLDDVTVLKGDPAQDRPVLVQMPAGRSAQGDSVQRLRTAAKSAAGGPPTDQWKARQLAAQADAWRRQMSAVTREILDTIDYAKLMVASGEYTYAVPNFRIQATQTRTMGPFPPNDREYVKQRWHYEAINLPGAVAALQGVDLSASAMPVVAVVDTGIVANHPDLANQLVTGFDFVSEPDNAGDGGGVDANPDDASLEQGFSFHGSHVAGTIAAQTYNGIGGAGVAPIARIMPVRVLGTGGSGSLYDILQGVRFAAGLPTDAGIAPAQRADVINLSLGATGIGCDDPMFRDLFNQVRARGAIVVAAAGNESRPNALMPVGFPANCPAVFSVAATDARNDRAFYSNVGPENFIAAPGGDTSQSTTGNGLPDGVYSTMASVDGGGSRLPTYGYLQGTSMATPHVAGVFALMRWANPALTPQAIEAMVQTGAIVDDLGAAGRDAVFGYGLVNARKAIDAALASRGGGPTPPPPPAAGRTEAQPSTISLGSIRTEADLVLSHVGSSTEAVVSVTTDSPVISVTPKAAGSVDPASGLGTYRVQANRAAMAEGTSAFPNIVIQLSPARIVTVQVAIERRTAAAGQGSLGPIYLLVLDAADPARPVVADTAVGAPVNGRYAYTVTVPGTASISIIAGSDINNNGGICSAGEACGAYPMLAADLEVLQPTGNLTGIDFSLGPYGGISPDAADTRR